MEGAVKFEYSPQSYECPCDEFDHPELDFTAHYSRRSCMSGLESVLQETTNVFEEEIARFIMLDVTEHVAWQGGSLGG